LENEQKVVDKEALKTSQQVTAKLLEEQPEFKDFFAKLNSDVEVILPSLEA